MATDCDGSTGHTTSRSGRGLLSILAASTALLTACAAPFSELQSARLAGPDRIEATPSYSAVAFSLDNETETVHDNFGIQLATGIGDRTDIRFRYERIAIRDSDMAANVIGGGPKYGLVLDRAALYVPIGFAFGDEIDTSETLQIHPTLLLTLPAHPNVELNGSLKALIPITQNDADALVALNVGLGLSPDFGRWVVRPEMGVLFNPGEEGHFRHFSVGLAYYFDRS